MRVKLIAIIKKVLDCNRSGIIAEWLADGLIANGVTVQKWIPANERLPDVGCEVLIMCKNKSYGVGMYSDTYRDFFSGQFPVNGVTHWMPLPEAPKEAKK